MIAIACERVSLMRPLRHTGSESGSVLVTSVLVLVILSVIGTAAINTSNTELAIARNDRLYKQAFYLAEAGIEHVKAKIVAGNSSQPIAITLSAGNYTATHTSGSLITSTGRADTASVTLQAKFRKPVVHPYRFGVFANSTITIGGNPGEAKVDSYNSTLGYAGSGGGNSGHIGVNSNTNGSITLNGSNTEVKGNATVGPGGDVNSTIDDPHNGIQGSTSVGSSPWQLVSTTSPCSGSSSGDYSLANNSEAYWGSGTYHYDALDIDGDLHVSGETTICVDTLDIVGQVDIASGAEVRIYITESMNAKGQGLVNNNGDPASLQIFGTDSASSIILAGQANYCGTVYAPSADVSVTGQGEVYGSLVGSTVHLGGNGALHYDVNLEDITFDTSEDLSLVFWKELFQD